jgi:undecaprenyl-diphosphatase
MHPVLSVALVVASGLAARDGRAVGLDVEVRRRIGLLRSPQRDAVLRVATDLGSLYGVGVVAGAVAVAGRPRLARAVSASGATAWALAQATKPLLPRERPYQADGAERLVVEPAGTSWPSGHAAVAAAMATTLGAGRGPAVRGLLGATAVGVALSRVYVGVHHATDVIAGLGLGALSARLMRNGTR